jgi:hypothetical protein
MLPRSATRALLKNAILAAAAIAVLQARPARTGEPEPESDSTPAAMAAPEGAADLAG